MYWLMPGSAAPSAWMTSGSASSDPGQSGCVPTSQTSPALLWSSMLISGLVMSSGLTVISGAAGVLSMKSPWLRRSGMWLRLSPRGLRASEAAIGRITFRPGLRSSSTVAEYAEQLCRKRGVVRVLVCHRTRMAFREGKHARAFRLDPASHFGNRVRRGGRRRPSPVARR
jgi:hypothetical protein